MFNIHLLKLPSRLQAESFERFAHDRYLPSLSLGQTRAGKLNGARLLRQRRAVVDEPIDHDNQFLMIADWEGIAIDLPPVNDPGVQRLFDAYHVEITRIGYFEMAGELAGENA
jgi:hypothetical protein